MKTNKQVDLEALRTHLGIVSTLKDIRDTQCSDGNWNYDPYMHGLANGLIMALGMFEGGEIDFLDAPAVWLKDNPVSEEKATESSLCKVDYSSLI